MSVCTSATFPSDTNVLMNRMESSAEDIKVNAKDASNAVVTITVCTPADILPTTPASPASAHATTPQNLTSQPNAGPTNTDSSNTVSPLGASACNNSQSCSLHSTSADYVCQYNHSTVSPTDCSGFVKTSTVTNTYLSTISNCNTTEFSFIATFTVTVTANISNRYSTIPCSSLSLNLLT